MVNNYFSSLKFDAHFTNIEWRDLQKDVAKDFINWRTSNNEINNWLDRTAFIFKNNSYVIIKADFNPTKVFNLGDTAEEVIPKLATEYYSMLKERLEVVITSKNIPGASVELRNFDIELSPSGIK